jgi:Caspase domain
MTWRLRPCAGLCLCMLAAAWNAQAADHALLVGVSDYPNLPRRLWLRAPGNDVALMHDALVARGFGADNIQQLVSRAGAAREPTRRNIVDALRRLQAQVQAGDTVVLYLAGHGSQQPQPAERGNRPTEADDVDEVFLPADVERWNGTATEAAIPNALLDDELAEWMDAVVDRGATVWAIFDICHAAGMARGRAAGVRAVSSVELGVPEPRDRSGARHRTQTALASGRTDGRALVLAARKHESTGEEWLPLGAPMGKNRLHGVFTYHLVQTLKTEAPLKLQDIERAMRLAYARERRVAPTPQFKGDAALTLR